MIARAENLKRKVGSRVLCAPHSDPSDAYSVQLSDLQENNGRPTLDVTHERLQHLALIEALPTTNSPDFSRWADTRLDRWLVDWTLRTGREKTARKLALERGIEVR